MSLGHARWRRRTALLSAGALTGVERESAQAHVAGCPRCAAELAALSDTRRLLDAEPPAEMPLPFAELEARVLARLAAGVPAPVAAPARRWAPLLAPLAAAAAVALAVWGVRPSHQPVASPAPASTPALMAEAEPARPAEQEMLQRMERLLAREQAARYLNEAQDVLVTVTSGPPPCPKGMRRVEVEEQARQRSRALLARRASLALGHEEVASAQPVMAEVEEMLREVADLPSCVRAGRLQAMQREIGRRRLLMKIDLMTRELQG